MKDNPDSSRFCWRPSWSNRFESLWSLMRKFAFFNEATAKNLQDVFGKGSVTPSLWVSRKRRDLRSYGGLDSDLLARTFGIERAVLDESTMAPFVLEGEHDQLTSGHLRFCRSCLKAGFHSSLHQILLIRECPLHKELLQDSCRECGTRVEYSLEAAPFASVTGCPECVGRSGANSEIRRRFLLISPEREEKFRVVASFLQRRRDFPTAGSTSIEWIVARKPANARERRISKFQRYWEQLVNGVSVSTPANETYTCFQYGKRAIVPTDVNSAWAGRDRYHHNLDAELVRILKSIRRQLEKHWLRSHRKCAFWIASRESLVMTIQEGTCCPYANILILWRLYWEDFDKLHYLLRPYRKRILYGNETPINWRPMPSCLPRELIHRLFAIECLAILEECHVLVRTLRRFNRYALSPGLLQKVGRCLPYWIIERTDNLWRLHVWRTRLPRKSWTKVMFPGASQPSHFSSMRMRWP